MGILTHEDEKRWADIQKTFQRNVRLRGMGADDKIGQAIAELSAFGDGLSSIREAMTEGVSKLAAKDGSEKEVSARVGELIAHVGGLQEGVAAVSSALTGGLKQVGELVERAAAQAAAREPAPAAFDPSVFKELAEAIRSVPRGTALNAAAAAAASRTVAHDEEGDPAVTAETISTDGGPGTQQQITVINKIPRTMLNVMEQQFKLMHGWMEPLTQLSHSQNVELQELKQLVAACLNDYEQLMQGLGKARERAEP
jgi:hypothetical protein